MKFFSIIYFLPAILFGAAKITSIGLAAPDVLSVEMVDSDISKGALVEYTKGLDDTTKVNTQFNLLKRNNQNIGFLLGADQSHLKTFSKELFPLISRNVIDDKRNYQLLINGSLIIPETISRKSTVYERGKINPWRYQNTYRHQLFLKLPRPVLEEQLIKLSIKGFAPVIHRFSSKKLVSPAIHINQNGYHFQDKKKIAWLSIWLGSENGSVNFSDYTNNKFKLLYEIINNKGKSFGTLPINLFSTPATGQENRLSGTYVYKMDFTSLDLPTGKYKIQIGGLGCSEFFNINNKVWDHAFAVAMQGLYHSRSGIEIDGRFGYKRPLTINPQTISQTAITFMNTSHGLGSASQKDALKQLTNSVPHISGGYTGALNDSHRIDHIRASWSLLNLYETFPKYFQNLNIGLPSSDETLPDEIYKDIELPDILDEAIYNIDFFRRLQNEDGGIRGGIEVVKTANTPSFLKAQKYYAYSADPWASFMYTATAARAAFILRSYNHNLADMFYASAEKSWNWAEKETTLYAANKKLNPHMKDGLLQAKVWAAAELYRLSKLEKYSKIFRQNIPCNSKEAQLGGDFLRAAWTWLLISENDPQLNKLVSESFKKSAISLNQNKPHLEYSYPSFKTTEGLVPDLSIYSLLNVHQMTGSALIEEELEQGSALILGANQSNVCFTIGLGSKNPKNLNHLDSFTMASASPKGLTIDGFNLKNKYDKFWSNKWSELYEGDLNRTITPNRTYWPFYESFFDHPKVSSAASVNINNTLASTACLWGYLAAIRAGFLPTKLEFATE